MLCIFGAALEQRNKVIRMISPFSEAVISTTKTLVSSFWKYPTLLHKTYTKQEEKCMIGCFSAEWVCITTGFSTTVTPTHKTGKSWLPWFRRPITATTGPDAPETPWPDTCSENTHTHTQRETHTNTHARSQSLAAECPLPLCFCAQNPTPVRFLGCGNFRKCMDKCQFHTCPLCVHQKQQHQSP